MMSVQPSSQTMLLYCPYDRRVTRHVRRGKDPDLICADCGRHVDDGPAASSPADDAILLQRTAPITLISARTRSMARPMRAQVQRTRTGIAWLPYALVLVIVAVGVFAAISVASSTIFAPKAATTVTAAPPGQQAQQAPAAAAPPPVAPAALAPVAVRVANTDGIGAYIRRTPSLADRLRAWPDRTLLKVVGPDTTAEGIEWKQVEDPAGNRGWIPAQYTVPEPSS